MVRRGPGSTPLRAAGKVLPFARLEVRDEDGTVLALCSEGELYAQVESQMTGFWNDDELTATRLVDGWVRTRDIGRINIWPAELETAVTDHPDSAPTRSATDRHRGGRPGVPSRPSG